MTDPLWITEREVVDLMSLPQAIDALRTGLLEEAAGQASNMVKTHAIWAEGSTLHALGAVFEGKNVVGAKIWAHTAGGAMPLLIVIDANNGSVLAIIEAFALGQMRTGSVSGLATDLLAKPDARRMAMIGAGKQSMAQVAAVGAVRRIDNVAVWSPTPGKRAALAAKIRDELQLEAIEMNTLEDALEGADVVTLATRARAPFLAADALMPGVHVNAVGSITPERAEFEPALLARATVVAADSPPQVRRLSREFMEAFGDADHEWARLQPLSTLVAENCNRPAHADLTVFKAMGMGISDMALGIALLEGARKAGLGRLIPRPVRVAPRLTHQQTEVA
ncbi:ornithine cyclodeaminase family protein [Sphingobium sp. H39-3-25]|uniref:ornithine cyclodeaminase family protein n=1 Tax=Sphingobium arseniciresistens TaxID=3030834 RepID=UPI0023B8BC71|nr:ornithine cyclodeaminase family protein [Sphingobium arseniciresistens]